MKLNVDTGFDQDLLEGSVGAVIRDQSGQFIATANEKVDICIDSFTAEALAVKVWAEPCKNCRMQQDLGELRQLGGSGSS